MNRQRIPDKTLDISVDGIPERWNSDDYFCVQCGTRETFQYFDDGIYVCLACGFSFKVQELKLAGHKSRMEQLTKMAKEPKKP